MGLVCGSTERGLSVCLIFRVFAFEPDYLAVILKREYMCSDTVEEPAVVTYDYGAACKILQRLFQGTNSVYVQ